MSDAILPYLSPAINSLRRTVLLVIWAACLLLYSSFTHAHEIRPAIVDLNYTSSQGSRLEGNLSVVIVLNLESVIAGIGPEHDNTDTAENADDYRQLRALSQASLLSEFERFQTTLLSSIKITTPDNQTVPLSFSSIDIPPVGDISIPRDSTVTLAAFLSNNMELYQWQWNKKFGEAIIRVNSDAASLDYAALLSPGQQSESIRFTKYTAQSVWSVLKNYILIGFEHILPKGLDHILFVIGLFLLTYQWRALALQVTTFTLAHSVTLALGATGILRIPASVVEPLIALSIVFICVENFRTHKLSKWRIAMVFVFGLLHGLGFASVLDEVGLSSNNFFIALLGFNIGVELGQLFVVTACLITLAFWFGKKPYYRKLITQPLSVVIAFIGLYWFFQRTFM